MIHARADYQHIQDSKGKIPEEEPVFLLRAQDAAAPMIVLEWAKLAELLGVDKSMISAATAHATKMLEWQQTKKIKMPDMPENIQPLVNGWEDFMIRVQGIINIIKVEILGREFKLNAEHDKEAINGRVYLQVSYMAPCTNTKGLERWKGRKWYLSKHMTTDEIVKTAYAAIKAAVEHEVMEGFKVKGNILFNPHVKYEALLNISHMEVKRQ